MPALHDFVCCCCFFFKFIRRQFYSCFSCYVMAAVLVDGKQKIAHQLALFVRQHLFISPLLFVSPEIARKPPISQFLPNNIAMVEIRLNQGFENKMQCCWGNKLPDPFNSYSTRGIFFSQLLEMAAPNKVCIDKYTREILAFILVYGREYY